MPRIDQRATYTIHLQGEVDADLADWCGPVTVTHTVTDDGQPVTILTGIETDQAGIFGVTRYLHGLGILLLSITREAASTTGNQGANR